MKKILFIFLSFIFWWILIDELILFIPTKNFALLFLSALFWAPVFSVFITFLSVYYFEKLSNPKLYWSIVATYSFVSLWSILKIVRILYFLKIFEVRS